jgi:hypothetical protein
MTASKLLLLLQLLIKCRSCCCRESPSCPELLLLVRGLKLGSSWNTMSGALLALQSSCRTHQLSCLPQYGRVKSLQAMHS